jgi:vanillate O-demethylase monooxygenase subunit
MGYSDGSSVIREPVLADSQMPNTPFLRNCWYIAAATEEVTSAPMARRIAGERMVLYRTVGGAPVALIDECCHRGVPLHLGTVIDDSIQCAYHGFTFDPSGACIRVPSQKSPPPNARVRSFHVLERHGWVWVWPGARTPDPLLVPDFSEADGKGWTVTRGVLTYQAEYQHVVDNILDLSHVSFVHRSTFGSDDALAALSFKEIDGILHGVRAAPPMPTPPLYRRLGFSEQIRQTKEMIYIAPCHVKAPITTFDLSNVGGTENEDMPRQVTLCILNSPTPETAKTCHYFWASARNFDLGDETLTSLLREQTIKAFQEDQLIIEAEQRSRDEGFRGGFAVRADMGGRMARRILSRRLEQEAGDSPRVESNLANASRGSANPTASSLPMANYRSDGIC